MKTTRREKIAKKYKEWARYRDDEWNVARMASIVKLVCDRCGYRWVESIIFTIPPCKRCGSDKVYEYETLQVG